MALSAVDRLRLLIEQSGRPEGRLLVRLLLQAGLGGGGGEFPRPGPGRRGPARAGLGGQCRPPGGGALQTGRDARSAAASQRPGAGFGFHWRDDHRSRRSPLRLIAKSAAVVLPLAAVLSGLGVLLGMSTARLLAVPRLQVRAVTR